MDRDLLRDSSTVAYSLVVVDVEERLEPRDVHEVAGRAHFDHVGTVGEGSSEVWMGLRATGRSRKNGMSRNTHDALTRTSTSPP